MLRKQVLQHPPSATTIPGEIAVASVATVLVTSESLDRPVEHVFDTHRGPGGTRWEAEAPGEQTLILAFDEPQMLRMVTVEVEEQAVSRTQVLVLALSS